MTLAESIAKILQEQVLGYSSLLELLQRERACLVDFDAEAVEELSKEKDTLLFGLRLLEDERARLMAKFSEEYAEEGGPEMTLKRVGEVTGEPGFHEIRSTLISLLQSIDEMNEFNRALIDRSLNYLGSTSGFFNTFGISSGGGQSGSLISKEI